MPVNIDKTTDRPRIFIDEARSYFLIEGNSYPPDVFKAYQVVFDWIREYSHQISDKLICEFKFNILNSTSRKMIYEIISTLDKSMAKKVEIHWYYNQNDEDIREVGEIISNHSKLPVYLIKTL